MLEDRAVAVRPVGWQAQAKRLVALEREALEGNPLLDFERLLMVRRRPMKDGRPGDVNTCTQWDVGLPRSSMGNSSIVPNVHDNSIVMLSPVSPEGKLTTVFALSPADDGREQVEPGAFRHLHGPIDHLADGLAFDWQPGGR